MNRARVARNYMPCGNRVVQAFNLRRSGGPVLQKRA
jgi:hypothetical protein